jgi:chromosome segregation ATPase
MSRGDWFTLQPFNFVTKQQYQTDISNITSQLATLNTEVNQLYTIISDTNLRLINLTDRVINLENNVNLLSDNVNKIEQNLTILTIKFNNFKVFLIKSTSFIQVLIT